MIKVIRLGHRIIRDARLTTHICLVSRAFGAHSISIFGEYDKGLLDSIDRINKTWGGNFSIDFPEQPAFDYIQNLKQKHFTIFHLTMYGKRIEEQLISNFKDKDIAIIIGSQKVPTEIYHLADYNISVTGQPHSEVAALSIFLDRLFKGEQLNKEFEKKRFFNSSKIFIKPAEHSKQFEKREK